MGRAGHALGRGAGAHGRDRPARAGPFGHGFRMILRAAPLGAPSRPKPGQRLRDGRGSLRIEAVAERDSAARFLTCFCRRGGGPMSYGAAAALQTAVYQHLAADAVLGAWWAMRFSTRCPVGPLPETYVTLGPEDVRDRGDGTGRWRVASGECRWSPRRPVSRRERGGGGGERRAGRCAVEPFAGRLGGLAFLSRAGAAGRDRRRAGST